MIAEGQAVLGNESATADVPGDASHKKKGRVPNSPSPDQPVLITADQVTHDRDLNSITARGHVEIDQGGRILLADTLSYNLKQDVVIANGNVSLTDLDGSVAFADYMELSGDLKNAAAHGIRLLMIDDARMAANQMRRTAQRTMMDKAVYTACQPCAEKPDSAPLWQLTGKRVIHDETTP